MQFAIFDFDGTLCATHDAIVHCIGLSFQHHGRRAPSPLQINETISRGIGLADTFGALDATSFNDKDVLDAWVRTYREYYNSDQGSITHPTVSLRTRSAESDFGSRDRHRRRQQQG